MVNVNKQQLNFKIYFLKAGIIIGIIIIMIMIMFVSNIGPWNSFTNLKGPYLSWQDDPRTTITITWQTPIDTNPWVEYGENTSYRNKINPVISTNNIYFIKITNLKPDTIYHYRILSSIKNYSFLMKDHWFKTAPNTTRSFTFIAYGDSRPDIFGNCGHKSICDQIKKISSDPAFILHTGDIVFQSNMDWQWDRFFWDLKDIIDHTPLFTTLGNHEYNEYDSDLGIHYFKFFNLPGNEWYYSFNYSNVHIICLNLSVSDVEISQTQINWLINDLNKVNFSNSIDWIVIFFHVPLYSSGAYGNDEKAIEALEHIFKDYKVELVIAGHDHQYERIYKDGVHYIVTGGGGSELEVYIGNNRYVQYSENIHHFCKFNVNRTQMNVEVISSLGFLVDQFTIYSNH